MRPERVNKWPNSMTYDDDDDDFHEIRCRHLLADMGEIRYRGIAHNGSKQL